jgi:ankyrin repeat protein
LFNTKKIKIVLVFTLSISGQLFADGESELLEAAKESLTAVEIILKKHHNININYQETGTLISALHVATHYEKQDIILLLLTEGARINVQDKYGFTPLHMAVTQRNLPLVKTLIEHGADKSVITQNRETPLDLALINDYKKISCYLRSIGAPKCCYDTRQAIADDEYGIREGGCILQ